MDVKELAVDALIPYARNPRKNDAAVDAVAASIKEFGFRQPIVVDDEMVVLVGHTRLKAAKKLGLKSVPVHVAEGLTEAQRKAYRIADNRLSELAEWDNELLGLELEDLRMADFDLGIDLPGVEQSISDDVDVHAASAQDDGGEAEKPVRSVFPVLVSLSAAQNREWQAMKAESGMTDDELFDAKVFQ